MVERVKKRNGRITKFDPQKITDSVIKAWKSAKDGEVIGAEEFAHKVANEIEQTQNKELTVEEIHNTVERKLMASSHKDVAKTYIQFRYLKQMARQQYDSLWEAVAEKLEAKNVKNQNANLDEKSFSGRSGEATGVLTKTYALNFLVSSMARTNHENNEVYIHDLDSYSVGSHNCLSVPIDDLLKNGFITKQTDVRPANSINTAFQLVAVMFQLQSQQQFGFPI